MKSLPGCNLSEVFDKELEDIKQIAEKTQNTLILNWLRNKSGTNSWVLRCINWTKTKMNRDDWFSTSFTTNIAESAHAVSQRYGVRLTLVAAIQHGQKIDLKAAGTLQLATTWGVYLKYGNNSLTGRTATNIK